MIPIDTKAGRFNVDIEMLEWDSSWLDNGRMLFHLVNDHGNHIEGYYFMGMDERGIYFIQFVNGIIDNDDGHLKIDGVDLI